MAVFADQMLRQINLTHTPRRIISVVPSQSEFLFDLGLQEEVIGITKFCIHPNSWYRSKTRIGGTKTLNLEKIAALRPDLIIGNKEENQQEQMEWLIQRFPVWMSDIKTLPDATNMMYLLGKLLQKETQAEAIINSIELSFGDIKPKVLSSCAYLIWKNPFICAASNTFINDLLGRSGFTNVFSHLDRYPEINEKMLQEAQPEIIFLSSEPFPFKMEHIKEFEKYCPNAKVQLVDGELFSWYGSRLIKAAPYLKNLSQKFG